MPKYKYKYKYTLLSRNFDQDNFALHCNKVSAS